MSFKYIKVKTKGQIEGEELLVPKLRFKEFNSEYKKYKIGDTLKVKSGKDQKSIECINGTYPILGTGGQIGTTNSFLYDKPSVLIGRKGTINKPQYMTTPFWTVDTLFYTDIKEEFNTKYIFYAFQNINWKKYDESTGVPSLSCKTIEEILYYIPNKDEQDKISTFITLLDKKIELQKKKIETLKIYKKGLIQELFSFNTFYEKKLEDICNITTGKLDANAMTLNGKYRFYTCAKEYYRINIYAFDTEALLISGNGAYVGYIHYYKGKFNAYQRTYVLDKFSENILYIKYYLDTFLAKRILAERKEGNTPYIVLNTLAKMTIIFPSSKVQNQIVSTLIKFDTKLDLENKKLDKLHIIKKSLLQQMFI